MHRVAVCSETNTAAGETLKTTQGGIVARFPRIPDLKRRLALIHVTRALNSVPAVYFVATVSAIAADEAIQARFNRGHGILGFNEYPNLEHVARFTIVGWSLEAGRDDDTVLILVKDVAVQRTPPTRNSATQ